jgi:RNA polymerase sigma-70 factor (ECF subfamily)
MTDASDHELVEAIKAGNAAALAALYDRHAGRVLALLVRWLGDRGDAEDLLQETFWQVWRRAAQYDSDRAPPVVWLQLIARSRALDWLRRRRPEAEIRAGAGPVRDDPAGALVEEESSQQVREALGQLPEDQRRVLLLAFFGGMTHEEIARQHAIPLGTVKTRIRLGMRRLRVLLGD